MKKQLQENLFITSITVAIMAMVFVSYVNASEENSRFTQRAEVKQELKSPWYMLGRLQK